MQLRAIGTIHTPWQSLDDCPRNVGLCLDPCSIALYDAYLAGLDGLHPGDRVELIYWLDRAESGEMMQRSRRTGEMKGVFALRTPNRPNPIGTAETVIEAVTESGFVVRGLDCLDGTPLLDIKPAFRG